MARRTAKSGVRLDAEQMSELRRFRLAADSSTDSIVMTTPRAEIIYVNSAWERTTGYSFTEAKGKNPRMLQSHKTSPDVYKKMWEELTQGRAFISEDIINKRKNGTLYDVRLSIYPVIEHGEVQFYVGLEQNISQRKQIEQAKTEFVSIASHQLRTPLAAMSWFAEMLTSGLMGKMTPEQKKCVEEIAQNSRRMTEMVQGLLNVSRIELGSYGIAPKPMQPSDLIERVVKELDVEMKKKRVRVQWKRAQKEDAVFADPILMHMIVYNLVSNAVKYSEGKTVTITFGPTKNGAWSVRVADTGIGIPLDQQDRIFDKMFRADNALNMQGTGLGLYIVKSIAEACGGSIWFESTEGVGSTFVFSLPTGGMIRRNGQKQLEQVV